MATQSKAGAAAPGKKATHGKPEGKIRFLSRDQPALKDGLYKLTLSHDFRATDKDPKVHIPPVTQYFAALGPRFSLPPREIVRTFPPDKTTGRYFDVLPHIQLRRSILPWERCLDPGKPQTPWLTLLLVSRREIETWRHKTGHSKLLAVRTGSLARLEHDAEKDPHLVFPKKVSLDPGESADNPIEYIDIPQPLLAAILPKEEELPLLAHVRQGVEEGGEGGSPAAKFPILMGNRLPQPGDENRIFLVSLEGRTDVYRRLGEHDPEAHGADPFKDPVVYRLAVLTSWRFASVKATASLEELLLAADHSGSATGSVLRLPKSKNAEVEGFYEKSYVPLRHRTRQGNRMVAWYRGPLLPGPASPFKLPGSIDSADQLVRFLDSHGMFDLSYAAAWELGRLLMLRDKRVSLALFHWKRAVARAAKSPGDGHLPDAPAAAPAAPPKIVSDWFAALGRLESVPFNYLFPREELLPPEALRFFAVDRTWVQAMIRGAFSIGRSPGDEALERHLYPQLPQPPDHQSGFVLRSQAVAGWPQLQIRGYDWRPKKLSPNLPFVLPGHPPLGLTRTRPAPDVLLALFDGNLEMAELYERPETIHFGVTYAAPDPHLGIKKPCYFKILRDAAGNPYHVKPTDPCAHHTHKDFTSHWVRLPFRDEATRTVDLATLSSYLQKALGKDHVLTPAEFALEMIASVPLLRLARCRSPK